MAHFSVLTSVGGTLKCVVSLLGGSLVAKIGGLGDKTTFVDWGQVVRLVQAGGPKTFEVGA